MTINLSDSKDLKSPIAGQVATFLNKIDGPWDIRVKERSTKKPKYFEDPDFDPRLRISYSEPCILAEKSVETWRDLFDRVEEDSIENGDSEDSFSILYTSQRNEKNWSSAFDPKGRPKGFVQAAYWDEILNSIDPIFPIVYETVTLIYQWKVYGSYANLESHFHHENIACINDFCAAKKDVILKLQSANICPNCYDHAHDNGFREEEIDFIDKVLDKVRVGVRTFNRRRVNRVRHDVVLPDFGNQIFIGPKELKLRPMDKAVYAFFLTHDEPLRRVDLENYLDPLFLAYRSLTTRGSIDEIRSIIVRIAENEDGVFDQIISRINRALRKALIPEQVEHYMLKTDRATGYIMTKAKTNFNKE